MKQTQTQTQTQGQGQSGKDDDGWEVPKGGKGRGGGGGGGGGGGRGRGTPTKKTPQRDDFEPAKRGKRGGGGRGGGGGTAAPNGGGGRGGRGGDWKSSSGGAPEPVKKEVNLFSSLTLSEDIASPKRNLEAEFEAAESSTSPYEEANTPSSSSLNSSISSSSSSSSSSSQPNSSALSFSMEEDIRQKIETLFSEYFLCRSMEEARYCLQDLGTKLHNPLVVSIGIAMVLEKPKEIPLLNSLFSDFVGEGMMCETDMNLGFMDFFKQLEDLVIDLPKAPTIVGPIVGHALLSKFFDVKFVASSLESLHGENRSLDLILSALDWVMKRLRIYSFLLYFSYFYFQRGRRKG